MYHVIAIERLYASGGNEIGKRLAGALGYKLYDRNILTESAKNLKIPAIYIESLEETSSGGFIFNLTKSSPFGGGPSEKTCLWQTNSLKKKKTLSKRPLTTAAALS